LWWPDDPLFPAAKVELGESGHFENSGLQRKHWSNAAPIRQIFKDAFQRAGLPYCNPHSFRDTLAIFGEKICPKPEAFKAWSQNLGHSDVLTTFMSYGTVAQHRQDEIMTELANVSLQRPESKPGVLVQPQTLERIETLLNKISEGAELERYESLNRPSEG
jgi:integrase